MKKTIRGKAAKLSRRTFIVGSAAAGGGLALGFSLPPGFGRAVAQTAIRWAMYGMSFPFRVWARWRRSANVKAAAKRGVICSPTR